MNLRIFASWDFVIKLPKHVEGCEKEKTIKEIQDYSYYPQVLSLDECKSGKNCTNALLLLAGVFDADLHTQIIASFPLTLSIHENLMKNLTLYQPLRFVFKENSEKHFFRVGPT